MRRGPGIGTLGRRMQHCIRIPGDHTTTTAQFPCYPWDSVYDLYQETEIGTTERLSRHVYSLVLLSMYIRKYPLIYSGLFLPRVLSVA